MLIIAEAGKSVAGGRKEKKARKPLFEIVDEGSVLSSRRGWACRSEKKVSKVGKMSIHINSRTKRGEAMLKIKVGTRSRAGGRGGSKGRRG